MTAEIGINGLTCSMCSFSVEKSILNLPYVSKVVMDLNSNIAHIEFNNKEEVNFYSISRKIEDAGFSVGYLVTEINSNHLPVVLNEPFKIGNQSFYILGATILNDPESIKIKFMGKYFKSKSEGKEDEKKIPLSIKTAYKKQEIYPVTIEN